MRALLIIITVVQAMYFALERPYGAVHIAALAAALVIAGVTAIRSSARWSTAALVVAAIVSGGVYLWYAAHNPNMAQHRLLQVVLCALYGALILAAVLSSLRLAGRAEALLGGASLAMAIIGAEVVLGVMQSRKAGPSQPVPLWVGAPAEHAALGMVYVPHSVLKTYYPDNPRNYFRAEDARARTWLLGLNGDARASLTIPDSAPGVLRVGITRVTSNQNWGVQLRRPGLAVTAGTVYTLSYRARAGGKRPLSVGIGQAHPPWDGLGFYDNVEVDTTWQTFTRRVTLPRGDENAQIHFDLGARAVSVEIGAISLVDSAAGRSLEPVPGPPAYSVTYAFNDKGCRGRDYAIPRPPGTRRVLLLGDSFTLGVGVHEEDTFARRLEAMLDSSAARRPGEKFEVINCGVSGYATREERLFYDEYGAAYDPQVVLLIVAWNDDMSFADEVKKGYLRRDRGRVEQVFRSWALVQDFRHRRPEPDYSTSARFAAQLDTVVRARGARLGVVFYGLAPPKVWEKLKSQFTAALAGSSVPIVDLQAALYAKHSYAELIVDKADEHINEIGNAIAAGAIFEFLNGKGLLAR